MLGGLFAGFVAVCILLLLLHTLQFIGLRIRNEAAAVRDPHLGRKFILHLFQHFAILLALSGFTISAIDISDSVLLPFQNKGMGGGGGGRGGIFFDDDSETVTNFSGGRQTFSTNPFGPPPAAPPKPTRNWWNSAQRFAVGLVLSGILHGSAIFAILLVGTNNAKFPAAGRAFGATRLVIAGIILMGCTTVMILAVLQKGNTDFRGLSMVIGMLAVWGPTALGHLVWMRWTMNPPEKVALRRVVERDERDEPEESRPRPVRKAARAPDPDATPSD